MSTTSMNPGEFDIDESRAKRLIATQFPDWTALPLRAVRSAGTDNAIYRLGEDLVVRLPRLVRAVELLEKELRWLPRLAPMLPLAIPVPVAIGAPHSDFPYPWAVYRWLAGRDLWEHPDVDMDDVAVRLGRFVTALRRIDPDRGPLSPRSGSLSSPALDERVRDQVRDLAADGALDADDTMAAWHAARSAPAWDGPPVWIHADLLPMNLLSRQGQLTAVIDFGLLGLGDPAHDVQPAWGLFTAATREMFRRHAEVDDATWARARGYALCLGLGAMHYYRHTNPVMAATGSRAVAEVVADCRR